MVPIPFRTQLWGGSNSLLRNQTRQCRWLRIVMSSQTLIHSRERAQPTATDTTIQIQVSPISRLHKNQLLLKRLLVQVPTRELHLWQSVSMPRRNQMLQIWQLTKKLQHQVWINSSQPAQDCSKIQVKRKMKTFHLKLRVPTNHLLNIDIWPYWRSLKPRKSSRVKENLKSQWKEAISIRLDSWKSNQTRRLKAETVL